MGWSSHEPYRYTPNQGSHEHTYTISDITCSARSSNFKNTTEIPCHTITVFYTGIAIFAQMYGIRFEASILWKKPPTNTTNIEGSNICIVIDRATRPSSALAK